MKVERPFGPDAPQELVTCPSPQPDGVNMPEGVCIRVESPGSPIAQHLKRYSACQGLGYCARASVCTLLIQQAGSEAEYKDTRQTW